MKYFSISCMDGKWFVSPTEELTAFFGMIEGSYGIFVCRLFGLTPAEMMCHKARKYGARMMKKPNKTGYFDFHFGTEKKAKIFGEELEKRWAYLVDNNIVVKMEEK